MRGLEPRNRGVSACSQWPPRVWLCAVLAVPQGQDREAGLVQRQCSLHGGAQEKAPIRLTASPVLKVAFLVGPPLATLS